ncbi:hypothetical protein [Salmonella enterica]|uniref:hypothetical protein n=1 Tax=Salmonella enterica TaxID=28901 RepID=UPI003D311FC2
MEQKHTPGPWYAVPNNAFIDIKTVPDRYSGKPIADICSSGHSFDNGARLHPLVAALFLTPNCLVKSRIASVLLNT